MAVLPAKGGDPLRYPCNRLVGAQSLLDRVFEVGRRLPFMREKTVDRLRCRVARVTIVTKQNRAAASRQNKRGARPGRARANNEYVNIHRVLRVWNTGSSPEAHC